MASRTHQRGSGLALAESTNCPNPIEAMRPVSARRRAMLYLLVDLRQQARHLSDRCEHQRISASICDFVQDCSLLCRRMITRHLSLCPNEPATIAAKQVRNTYLLETICTSLYLEGPTPSKHHSLACLRHKLPFWLTSHGKIIPKVGGDLTA